MATIHDVQAPGRAAFGVWLKQARDARGLTLDDLNSETKIPLRNLQALEHGDLEIIPRFYQRAEVRAIARALGVDEGLAIGQLDSATTPAVEAPEQRQAGEGEAAVPRPRLTRNGALAVVAFAFGVTLAASGIREAAVRWTEPPQRVGNAAATAESIAATSSGNDAIVVPASRQEPVGVTSQTDADGPLTTPATTATAGSSAAFTELVIQTDPPNARITVNGISWGESPVTIRHLPAGPKRIRATKDGFAAAEQVLAVGDGQRQTLNLRLQGAE